MGNHSLHVQSCHTHSKASALVVLCKLLHGAQFGHNYSRTLLAPLVDQNSEAHAAKLHTTHGATESYMDHGINSGKECSKKQVTGQEVGLDQREAASSSLSSHAETENCEQ